MNTAEAYKLGFLLRCADEGLSCDQTSQRIKSATGGWADWVPLAGPILKSLSEIPADLLNAGKGAVKETAKSMVPGSGMLGNVGLALAGAAPPAIGAGLGYMAANAQDDAYDEQDAKRDEELAEYYRAIEQLQRRRA